MTERPDEVLHAGQAILLSGLALKRRWQEKRKAAGITEAVTPNIVCSSAVHVSLLSNKSRSQQDRCW